MEYTRTAVLAILGLLAIWFVVFWARSLRGHTGNHRPTWGHLAVGFLTDFLDTLGIGSYAITTSLFRLKRMVADEQLPGTMTIGHALPTCVQAFIFINIVEVNALTLSSLIFAAVVGAWLGAGVVSSFNRKHIQVGMAGALLAAASLMIASILGYIPKGGEATALTGTTLIIALVGNFIFGSLMTIGVGAYAPIMIMVSLLGMNPKTAFPIMMGSCAFLMPVASYRFIKTRSYNKRAALGLAIGGIPAVLIAGLIVKELPLEIIRILVIVVVIYSAFSLLRSAVKE